MFSFIFSVIVYFSFYRISSCLFFRDATDWFSCRRRTLLLLIKKPENPSNPHLICHSGFDIGVIFVTLYSFLMLILWDQLFIFITTVHCYFLSKKNLPGYWPFCPSLAFSSFHLFLWYAPRHMHARHFCSGCDKKKVIPQRNFFRNLNFKNIVIFFKRTCWNTLSMFDKIVFVGLTRKVITIW